jgi:hypothetical protein
MPARSCGLSCDLAALFRRKLLRSGLSTFKTAHTRKFLGITQMWFFVATCPVAMSTTALVSWLVSRRRFSLFLATGSLNQLERRRCRVVPFFHGLFTYVALSAIFIPNGEAMDSDLVDRSTMRARMGAARATMPCLDHALNMAWSRLGCHRCQPPPFSD